MPQETWQYESNDVNVYRTDGYNDPDGVAGTDADIDSTERFTDDIDLSGYEVAVIDFKFDASGATDDLTLSLYKRRDSSWDGDEIAIWSAVVPSDGSEDIYNFTITKSYGPGHYRFGMVSGATDTFEMEATLRYARVTIS